MCRLWKSASQPNCENVCCCTCIINITKKNKRKRNECAVENIQRGAFLNAKHLGKQKRMQIKNAFDINNWETLGAFRVYVRTQNFDAVCVYNA